MPTKFLIKAQSIYTLDHFEMINEFSPALTKWIKFRLDCKISDEQILFEIQHASKVIIDSITNPMCKGVKSQCH